LWIGCGRVSGRRDVAPREPLASDPLGDHGAGESRDGLGVQRGVRESRIDLRERGDASGGMAGGQSEPWRPGEGVAVIRDVVAIWVEFLRERGG
jgi:hypothetical protein